MKAGNRNRGKYFNVLLQINVSIFKSYVFFGTFISLLSSYYLSKNRQSPFEHYTLLIQLLTDDIISPLIAIFVSILLLVTSSGEKIPRAEFIIPDILKLHNIHLINLVFLV